MVVTDIEENFPYTSSLIIDDRVNGIEETIQTEGGFVLGSTDGHLCRGGKMTAHDATILLAVMLIDLGDSLDDRTGVIRDFQRVLGFLRNVEF